VSAPAPAPIPAPVPGWLDALAGRLDSFPPLFPDRAPLPAEGSRRSAVLILFGPAQTLEPAVPSEAGVEDELAAVDVLLTERSHGLRSHAGQVAFPGGAIDPGDDGPVGAALREAQEETGLDTSGVRVLGELPSAYIAPSGYVVTPVLAWWERPSPVTVMDPREVARVARVRVSDLLHAPHRFQVRHPSGYVGPGFEVDGLFVWGATAQMLNRVLTEAGLERPWDTERFEELPPLQVALREGRTP
jgi:8-oxo-dGTP pyrophosphatase MutT (NUDIX family)